MDDADVIVIPAEHLLQVQVHVFLGHSAEGGAQLGALKGQTVDQVRVDLREARYNGMRTVTKNIPITKIPIWQRLPSQKA